MTSSVSFGKNRDNSQDSGCCSNNSVFTNVIYISKSYIFDLKRTYNDYKVYFSFLSLDPIKATVVFSFLQNCKILGVLCIFIQDEFIWIEVAFPT